MGLFSGFKKIINKTITLSPYQRNDMVVFSRLKGGELKLGSEIEVEEGYCAILTHYDNICDLLMPGTHKFDGQGMPILSKFAKPVKTKAGYVAPKKIKADLYYINLKSFDNNYFKTVDRVTAYSGKDKVKMKVDGTYNVKVTNALKLMKTLLSELAVVKDGRALKEIGALTGEAVAKILNSNNFQLQDYIDRDPEITKVINDDVNKTMEKYGVEDSCVVINQLYLKQKPEPKGDEKKEEVTSSKAISLEPEKVIDLNNIKGLKEAIGNVGKKDVINIKPVVIGASEYQELEEKKKKPMSSSQQTSSVVINNKPTTTQSSPRDAYEMYSGQFANNQHAEQPVPEIIVTPATVEPNKDVDDSVLDNLVNEEKQNKKKDREKKIEEIVSKIAETKPSKTVKEPERPKKYCKYCNTALEMVAKFCYNCGKSTEEYISCPCCGAKNFSDATECLLCHSKLN